MSIILFSIHRVACNDIFRGDDPQIGGGGGGGGGPVPPGIYAYAYRQNTSLVTSVGKVTLKM